MKDVHELEVYACIDGYPDYLVTSHGRVLSLKDRHGRDRIKELKQYENKKGYLYADLYNNKIRKHLYVHRLVAISFIPNKNDYKEINHKDENKQNNNILILNGVIENIIVIMEILRKNNLKVRKVNILVKTILCMVENTLNTQN